MKYDYTSLFITTPKIDGKKIHKNYEYVANGVEMTRDIQATIMKMSDEGFDLFQTIPITSTAYYGRTYTEGVTLIFRKLME